MMVSERMTAEVAQKVFDWRFQGNMGLSEIAEKLKEEEGMGLTPGEVLGWLNRMSLEIRKRRGGITSAIERHVREQLPKDLDALEELEKKSLGWVDQSLKARVTPILKLERVQKVVEMAAGKLERVAGKSGEERKKAARDLAGWVVKYVTILMSAAREHRKDQLTAMKAASDLISIKLKFSAALQERDQGKINIHPTKESGAGGDGKVIQMMAIPSGVNAQRKEDGRVSFSMQGKQGEGV